MYSLYEPVCSILQACEMKLNELKPSVGMELAKEAGERGIEVLRVVAAGSAESAGITRGSCVNAINGVALVSTLDFITEVLSLSLLCHRAPSFCRRVRRPHASRTPVPTNLAVEAIPGGRRCGRADLGREQGRLRHRQAADWGAGVPEAAALAPYRKNGCHPLTACRI